MRLTRRTVLAGASAALLAPRIARAVTVADDAGRAVTVADNVQRVLPAGPPAAIMLYTLAPDLLLGWPRANGLEECAYMLPDICARPEVGRLTGRGNTASLENVIALRPDLIVDVGATSERYISLANRTQEQTRIPYALLDGRFLSLSTTYEKLGRLVGRERDGLDFADYCNMTLGSITNRIALVAADQRPRVYYARGPRGLTTGLGGSASMETIELIARNVAGATHGGLADVSIEQVVSWNPDAIIASDPAFADAVRKDPAWSPVKAVRDNQVYLAPRLPFGWVGGTPSANRLIGLWWLVKIFYPDLFPEDMHELTRDFFSKFYHVTPTDARISHALGEPI
ncbi:MAG: iron ABC transporter substrate-binding protein [Pseudolabrys sp.]